MQILWLCTLLAINTVSAFRPGQEGRINTPWAPPTQIIIGQNTLVMIEELLKETRPELIPKIGQFGNDIYAIQIPDFISDEFKKEIEECLGDDIFEEKKKLP